MGCSRKLCNLKSTMKSQLYVLEGAISHEKRLIMSNLSINNMKYKKVKSCLKTFDCFVQT